MTFQKYILLLFFTLFLLLQKVILATDFLVRFNAMTLTWVNFGFQYFYSQKLFTDSQTDTNFVIYLSPFKATDTQTDTKFLFKLVLWLLELHSEIHRQI